MYRHFLHALAAAVAVFLASPAPAMSPVFGPRQFARQSAAPEEITATFRNCEPTAQFRLVLVNGARRVSSAAVTLNGVDVIRPNDLNQTVASVTRTVALLPDNVLAVRLAGAPGSSVTITIECTSGCIAVAITTPTANATLRGSALVQGTVASGDDAGVTINGVAAAIDGGRFTALVPLAPGSGWLEATATNNCGHTASASLPVQVLPPPEELSGISVAPARGLAPLPVRLGIVPSFPSPIASITWDLDGDGTPDASGADLTEVETTYDHAGIFTPTVSVRDASGTEASAAAFVVVHDAAAFTAFLNARWSAFASALRDGRADVALSLIDSSRRDRDEPRLRGDLAAAATLFAQPLELREVRGSRAFCTAGGHAVVLRLDDDGIWRIRFF